jgi:carnitine-CoA ligase
MDDDFIRLFAQQVQAAPERVYATFNGAPITLGALDRQSDSLASALRGLGLRAGDRVALMLRNSPGALATLFGLAKAGLVWVPINAQQRGEGLRYVLGLRSGALRSARRRCGS